MLLFSQGKKNNALEHQQAALDKKVEEVSALQGEKPQLDREFQLSQEERGKLEKTQQLESMRAAGRARRARDDRMRDCPVCYTKFPARMAQQEFERHVQGHVLTARQEECKVKEARVAELERKLAELQRKYQQLVVGTNFLFPHTACCLGIIGNFTHRCQA